MTLQLSERGGDLKFKALQPQFEVFRDGNRPPVRNVSGLLKPASQINPVSEFVPLAATLWQLYYCKLRQGSPQVHIGKRKRVCALVFARYLLKRGQGVNSAPAGLLRFVCQPSLRKHQPLCGALANRAKV